MKVLGHWSLASLVKALIDVAYYGLFLVLGLLCAVALWLAVTPERRGAVSLEIPVRFELDPASHPFSTADRAIESVSLAKAEGTLRVKGAPASVATAWAPFVVAIISLATILLVVGRLRAVFRTLKEQDPFASRNPARIRAIGILLVVGQLVGAVSAAWLAAGITKTISITGVVFQNTLSLNTWVLFAGVVLVMLAEVFRLGAQMKGDLETARKIQFDLVPGEDFRKDDLVVRARMLPARTVGGDCYDVRDLEDGRVAMIVGDVTGKGLPAALLMTSVLGSARALLSAGLRGSDLIAALNRHLCANSGGRFVTLFYAELQPVSGTLTYVNAGHNPPLLSRADGTVERLPATTMLLGVEADAPVEARQTEIGPADRLLLFTDGMTEAFNRKQEEYGEERLRDSLLRARTLPPAAALDRVVADTLGFCGSAPQHDDMTLLLVARQPA